MSKKLAIYKKIIDALQVPMTVKEASKATGISESYIRMKINQLIKNNHVRAYGVKKDTVLNRPSITYLAKVTSIEDIPPNVYDDESKGRDRLIGAMAKVENLKEKTIASQRLIHRDRQNAFHRQGAIASGNGVEFV